MKRIIVLVVGLMVVAAVVPASVGGASEAPLRAVIINGASDQGIAPESVGRYHCHDLLRTEIRCFSSEAARDADIADLAGAVLVASLSPTVPAPGEVMPASTPCGYQYCAYVTWYEHENYGGASFSAFSAWSDLSTIGWNDTITSFKSWWGGRPFWFIDANYRGLGVAWSSGAWVANVGSYWNDTFSSVYNYCWGC